jgi:cellulose synthase operon protein YhjQ
MSDKKTPEDVTALLLHTKMSAYKVFTQERRRGNHNFDGPERRRGGDPADNAGAPVDTASMRLSPEASTLEFVRPQPPRWSLLQELGTENDSATLRGDSQELRVPTFAVCATGGGTGKTTVSATLGRALSLNGENVLMIHGALQASAPLHFGAQQGQAGRLRSFVPPVRNQGTMHMLSHEFDNGSAQNEEGGAWLLREANSLQNEIGRCILEISSPRAQEAAMMNLAGVCLVVLTPDINSVMALGPFRKVYEGASRQGASRQPGVHFLINKFDPASAFHAEVRQNLRSQLGARLLPFCIRRDDAIAEALAAGMTILDYAPRSAPAEDFLRLATWAREVDLAQRSQGAI